MNATIELRQGLLVKLSAIALDMVNIQNPCNAWSDMIHRVVPNDVPRNFDKMVAVIFPQMTIFARGQKIRWILFQQENRLFHHNTIGNKNITRQVVRKLQVKHFMIGPSPFVLETSKKGKSDFSSLHHPWIFKETRNLENFPNPLSMRVNVHLNKYQISSVFYYLFSLWLILFKNISPALYTKILNLKFLMKSW